jgi:hypothetical protein
MRISRSRTSARLPRIGSYGAVRAIRCRYRSPISAAIAASRGAVDFRALGCSLQVR